MSAISAQWLEIVLEITNFFSVFQSLEENLDANG